MPRRCMDNLTLEEAPRKKTRIMEDVASVDVSFCDDEALPPGIVFTDILQKKWRIGKPIGRGSFGRIYLASDEVDKEVTKVNARYVVKIEPHTNGPLFVEVHCLIRTAQAAKVKAWRLHKSQKRLGMPIFIASGSFTDEATDTKYRFLVLPRYDIDLQKIISRGRTLDLKNTLVLAIQILDVLEYLHKQGYTHSDIKSSNLMLGFDGAKIFRSQNTIKPIQSFQKETKTSHILSGKQKRPRASKSRHNYYEDEDFVLKYMSSDEESGDKMGTIRKNVRKVLHDKQTRALHRNHAFNLRQLTNNVNYQDMNSSVCSDDTYQKLLDGKNNLRYSSDEGFHSDNSKNGKKTIKTEMLPPKEIPSIDVYKEAVFSQSNGQIYLLDYGLASKFMDSSNNHKDFAMDARKAHDGTLEYSSRDSHIGAHSRRSDLETLGYNLLDWMTGTLPWKTIEMLSNPDLVHALKKNYMGDVKSLLKSCFKTENYPQFLEKYLQYVTNLEFTEKPDYDHCRQIFKNEFLKNGFGTEKDIALDFSEPPMSPMNRKKILNRRFAKRNPHPKFLARGGITKPFGRENFCSLENNIKMELMKQTLNSSSDGVRKPCVSRNFFVSDAELVANLMKSLMPHDIIGKKLSPKNLRSNKRTIAKKRKGKRSHRSSIGKFGNFMGSAKQFTWAEILAGNPEDIIRKDRNTVADTEDEDDDEDNCKYRIRKMSNSSDCSADVQSPLMQKDYLNGLNPTYAMKEVISNLKKKVSGKQNKDDNEGIDKIDGYTPAMVKLLKIKEAREAKEKQEIKFNIDNVKIESQEILPRVTRSKKSKVTNKSNVKATPKKSKKKENINHDYNPKVVLSPYKLDMSVSKIKPNVTIKIKKERVTKKKKILGESKEKKKDQHKFGKIGNHETRSLSSTWTRQTRSSSRRQHQLY